MRFLISIGLFTAWMGVATAQEASLVAQPARKLTKKEVLDSIKASFVHDKVASCIDSLWMKELNSLDMYQAMTLDIKNLNIDEKVDYELPTELLKERLQKLDAKSPFNIEYNPGLENVIKSFLKNRKKAFERLMGMSQYYFPMFEDMLASQNLPLEIKYLAVVESALNPRAVSRVGATGLWQFMFHTGRQYNLNIDSYVDDRCDPLKASRAAAQYMTNMYAIFGDWDLVLASYNSGPGNVAKAIRRSGGQQNYWNIRKHLPKETQGYLPAFLATMYIFEYHKEHGIKPDKAIFNHFATDTVHVKNAITFKQLAALLDMPVDELQFLNPSFKRGEIPVIEGRNHYLRLPLDKMAVFTSNEDKIYAYANYEFSLRERPFNGLLAQRDSTHKNGDSLGRIRIHKVRRGETLAAISARYGVVMDDLKKWNHLRTDRVSRGRRLTIRTAPTAEAVAQNTKVQDSAQVATAAKTKGIETAIAQATPVVKSEKEPKTQPLKEQKEVIKQHQVQRGESLAAIAEKYQVRLDDLKKWNHLRRNSIAAGKKLNIHVMELLPIPTKKEGKTNPVVVKVEEAVAAETNIPGDSPSDYYEVQKGDNLFSIAKKFNVSVEDLKNWNKLQDNALRSGARLTLVRQDSTSAQAAVAHTTPKTHTVAKGEFLAQIARQYQVTLAQLKSWNGLTGHALKVGQTLIVSEQGNLAADKPKEEHNTALAESRKAAKMYLVKKGDSLFSISKKHPGVSVADLKKWNDIKGEELMPGMKLRING